MFDVEGLRILAEIGIRVEGFTSEKGNRPDIDRWMPWIEQRKLLNIRKHKPKEGVTEGEKAILATVARNKRS